MITHHENDFLQFIIKENILCFGQFTLKSGRRSPYFYNSGLFNTGAKLAKLGQFYAHAIVESGLGPDMLFGPAYKGIPLVSATSIALAQNHHLDLPYAFNRKENKAHGEGGQLVGAKLCGKVMIVDDVISAGLTVGESIAVVRQAGAEAIAVIVAFDREEIGEQGKQSARQQVEQRFNINVLAISGVASLSQYLGSQPNYAQHLANIRTYLSNYGAV